MKSPWLLRILALAGFFISAYLLSQKLMGRIDSIAGCGAGSGCSNVLGSRWSQFFGIPVTGLSSLLYAALFAVSFKPNRTVQGGLAVCFLGAALWFFGVLIFDLKAFCPWCTAAHVIGITSAVLLFRSLKRPAEAAPGKKGPAKKESDVALHLGVVGGFLGVFVLILGQVFGPVPDTHRITTGGSLEVGSQEQAVHAGGGGEEGGPSTATGRQVKIFDDNKVYNTSVLPHVGPADAPHVIAKYFDYTCGSCKDMHKDLHLVAEKHPGKFCMIMLPVPLNRECNPHFPTPLTNHEHACELARLSLAAWRANPEVWPQVHETLFTRPVLQPEIAEVAVAQLVGEEELAKAMEDPWVEEIIKADVEDFRQFVEIGKTPKMPKLVYNKGKVLHGLTRTAEILLQSLEKEFGLPPSS